MSDFSVNSGDFGFFGQPVMDRIFGKTEGRSKIRQLGLEVDLVVCRVLGYVEDYGVDATFWRCYDEWVTETARRLRRNPYEFNLLVALEFWEEEQRDADLYRESGLPSYSEFVGRQETLQADRRRQADHSGS